MITLTPLVIIKDDFDPISFYFYLIFYWLHSTLEAFFSIHLTGWIRWKESKALRCSAVFVQCWALWLEHDAKYFNNHILYSGLICTKVVALAFLLAKAQGFFFRICLYLICKQFEGYSKLRPFHFLFVFSSILQQMTIIVSFIWKSTL